MFWQWLSISCASHTTLLLETGDKRNTIPANQQQFMLNSSSRTAEFKAPEKQTSD